MDSSKKDLKVIAILSIILGMISVSSAALLVVGGKAAAQSGELALSAEELRLVTIAGISIALAVLVFAAANTIKKSVGK